MTSPSRRRAAAALIFVLGAAACSGGGGPQDQPADDTGGADTTSQTVDDPSAGAAEDDASSEDPPAPEIDRYGWIGDGVAITMARAESPTGHVQAEIVRLLLTEFGYTVNDLENVELSAEYFHEVLGEGEIDLWADGRYPDHEVHWAIELADGSTVGDHVSTVGDLVLGGALRGFVTNALVAAETPGLTLDLIDDDDEVRAPYDAADPSPVDETAPDQTDDDDAEELLDGRVAVLGCVEDSLCADQIDEQIRFARWRTIEQAHGETADLTEAGFSARPEREVMRFKYAKLLMNLFNVLQAGLTDPQNIGSLRRQIRDEALACFRAAGIDCANADEVRERQRDTYEAVEVPGHPRTAGSSWQSVERGTGDIETDYLNGEICLLGRLYGVPTPANDACVSLARTLLRTESGPGLMSVEQFTGTIGRA